MKIKLLISRGGMVDGRYRSYQPGDVVDVSDDEAKRLIVKGRAEAIEAPAPKPKRAKKETKTESDD